MIILLLKKILGKGWDLVIGWRNPCRPSFHDCIVVFFGSIVFLIANVY